LPALPQLAQAASVSQLSGHFAMHLPSTQASVDWQCLRLSGVQAMQRFVAASQT
jgi:hypothetical protein